jgi:hypothetical protein
MGAPLEIIEIAANECSSVTHDDKCEAGFLIGGCLKEVTKKHNYEINI